MFGGFKIFGRWARSGEGVKVGGGGGSDSWWGLGGGRLEINRECFFQELMIEFHFIPFHSISFHFHSIPFHSIPIHSIPCFTQCLRIEQQPYPLDQIRCRFGDNQKTFFVSLP